ncbi:MAG: M48 family metallopeptidase [Defluviimonas sp.]|uniref:M48 family metallopeptidase n=1 Tax=Albidovulum sp. TaxID=1872424 RepID=UPI002A2E8846|nr:M48 family metallopeptidase [Defluviimonas sp.]
MTRRTLQGDPPVEITLRKSARARRFSLRVSQLDGRVTLSMPARAEEAAALAFAEEKAAWLRRVLGAHGPREALGFGSELLFEGRRLVVRPAQVRAPVLSADAIHLPQDPARVGARLQAYLKLVARQRLQAACERHAGQLGRRFRRITLRDTRSRWGSCTAQGDLMFSWRLVMAPAEVLDYVAAHEVAHLAEMNHSPAFWAVVARLVPDYERHRRWLRSHGAALHRVDFGS